MKTREQQEIEIQKYYQSHAALVTSPFITQYGEVNCKLLESVACSLGLSLENGPFLDVGCGTGLLSTYMRNKTGRYIGLDINRHQNFSGLQCSTVHFTQASSMQLPVKDNSIGLLACVDSFEHYPDHPAVAREMARVLRPDGAIFLSVPTYANVAGWVKKRMEKSGKYKPGTWAPFDYWKPQEYEFFITPDHLRQVFGAAGFTDFRVLGLSFELAYGLLPWLWHPRCPAKIERLAARAFRLFAGPITKRFPHWSLHTVWRIAKH